MFHIRPITLQDVPAMHAYINTLSAEKTFITFQGENIPLDQEQTYVESVLKSVQEKNKIELSAWDNEVLIGLADVTRQPRIQQHVGLLGITVAKEYRGKGVGQQLMAAVLEQAKSVLGLEIVELDCFASNVIGLHVYKKLGFLEYGRLPRGIKRESGYDDNLSLYKVL